MDQSSVFIVHGFNVHKTAQDKSFELLREGLARQGFRVLPCVISWRQTTISHFAEQFQQFYKDHKSKKNIVIGNSFGAVVAFITAARLKPDLLVLCSLSPFFKEDVQDAAWRRYGVKRFGQRRMRDIEGQSAHLVAQGIKKAAVETVMTYGELEEKRYPTLVNRVKQTAEELGITPIAFHNVPHSLDDTSYTMAILDLLQSKI